MSEAPDGSPDGSWWTPAQRRGLSILLAFVIAFLGYLAIRRTSFIDDPPEAGIRASELVSKLDPNTAEANALLAIPGLGERRSRDIVAYREKMKPNSADGIVFYEIDDLMQIRGIGPALSKQMEPYLEFPATQPGTKSAATNPVD
ncbi:MAG TPA: helix-hairpin-helix domain-containing protein [Tepidisphaeraceae bacterium]|nr:helix-hairpin-helix domain-containing protein [Tepidisphaeraceae bacterium]